MGPAKSILIDPDRLAEGDTMTLSQLSPYAQNLKSNNYIMLLRCSA
jgi:hypothetical protein